MSTYTGNNPPSSATIRISSLLKQKKFVKAAQEAEAALRRWPQSPALRQLLGQAARAAIEAIGVGGDEAVRMETAHAIIIAADDAGALEDEVKGAALAVLLRLGQAEEAERRWPFAQTGRELVAIGDHRSLIYQLPRVVTAEDRRELLGQHAAWGDHLIRQAIGQPIRRAPRRSGGPLRVGLLSSDLRIHVVMAYADPLIEHAKDNDVELYCYSAYPGPADAAQQAITAVVAGYRHLPSASTVELAQAIADDALDVLIEIGGSTNHNRAEVMAHRLAPVQASWIGYPHSVGLRTIDYFICDPHMAPRDPGLLLERPLRLPRSWLAFPSGFFRDEPAVARELPEERKGHVTFGTANSTYKYSTRTLDAWAKVLAGVPRSRFLIVRPEGGSKLFRETVQAHFARQDVAADRIEFAVTRGGHLPYYGEIDITLDTMPQTGGVTTCEALWMGVPVVSLAGEAVYERLSHSILTNAGLGELSVGDVESYIATAIRLADDRELRRAWRAGCRDRIRAGPLGDEKGFAADFFAAVRQAMP